jgi:hypothetical protein
MANDAKSNIKVMGKNLILSYPNLEEARRSEGASEAFYGCTLIADDKSNLAEIKTAVMQAATAKFGAEAAQMFKDGEIKSPFRTDVKKKGYPAGTTFFSCKSKQKPGVVGLVPDANGKPAVYRGEVYAGLRVNATLRPYFYPQQGGGFAIGLGNVQVIGPSGLRFDNRVAAEDEFEADENAAAAAAGDMSDIL